MCSGMLKNLGKFQRKIAVSTMKNEIKGFSEKLESLRHVAHHSLKKFPAFEEFIV